MRALRRTIVIADGKSQPVAYIRAPPIHYRDNLMKSEAKWRGKSHAKLALIVSDIEI
jgi:hypothetical protein